MKRKPSKYPKGWNAAKVRGIIDYYEKQSDDEGAFEIEHAPVAKGSTWVHVPIELVPRIRNMIARRKKSA